MHKPVHEPTLEGFWYSKHTPNFPVPTPAPWPYSVPKETFLKELRDVERKTEKIYYRGWSNCRICDKRNGTFTHDMGEWRWPEGYIHYIEEHNVVPSLDFVIFIAGSR